MWQLRKLHIENILSFEKETIEFKNNQLTLIQGINETDSGSKSNGSGKSTILECIKLALTTNTIKKINKVDIIRNDENVNEGYIELQLNNIATGENFTIKKYLHRKKSNKCELFENDIRIDRLVDLNISESDKYILSKIGITSEELDNYFLISKEKYVSFFNAPDRTKKELLNQFSKTDKLEKINDLIKNDYSYFDSEKQKAINQIAIYNSNQDLLKQQILKLDDDKKSIANNIEQIEKSIIENQTKIDSINHNLKEYPSENFDDEITSLEQQKSAWTGELLTQKESALNSFKINQKIVDDKIKEVKYTVNELDSIINKANIDLKSTVSCPKCNYEFVINSADKNVEEIKQTLQECLAIKQEAGNNIKQFNDELTAINKQILEINNKDVLDNEELNKLKTILESLKVKRATYTTQYNNIQSTLKSLLSVQETYLKQLDQLKNSFVQNKEEELNLQLEHLDTQIIGEQQRLLTLDQSVNELSSTEHTLNSFRTTLANNSLEYIQQKANEFMERIKCSYKILISGYKLLSTGKIKDEITIGITRDGINEESFNKFSSGEKAKADLSCILALNEIINYNVSPLGLDFLLIDEVLESVDEDGFVNIINSLNQLNKTIFLITHVSPDSIHDVNKIVVKKSNGISKILN